MSNRNFKKAVNMFLDSISTFTTYELFPYDIFIFYTVVTSIISLDRVSMKQKVFYVLYYFLLCITFFLSIDFFSFFASTLHIWCCWRYLICNRWWMLLRSWQCLAKSHIFQSFWTPYMTVNTSHFSQHSVGWHLLYVVDTFLMAPLNTSLFFVDFLSYSL